MPPLQKLPAGHCTHVSFGATYVPFAHTMQLVSLTDPTGLQLPAAEQGSSFITSGQYEPAAHCCCEGEPDGQ